MGTITFDTFKFVDRLEKTGLSREQTAVIVEAQQVAFSEALDISRATKADVREVRTDLDLLRKDVPAMEFRLTIKLGAFLAVFTGVIIAALRVPL